VESSLQDVQELQHSCVNETLWTQKGDIQDHFTDDISLKLQASGGKCSERITRFMGGETKAGALPTRLVLRGK